MVDKEHNTSVVIDVTIPVDNNKTRKEHDKIEKYHVNGKVQRNRFDLDRCLV